MPDSKTMLEYATNWIGGLVQNWCNGMGFWVTIEGHDLVIRSGTETNEKVAQFNFGESLVKNSRRQSTWTIVQHQLLDEDPGKNRNLVEIADSIMIRVTETTTVIYPSTTSDRRESLANRLFSSKTPQFVKHIMEKVVGKHKEANLYVESWRDSILSFISGKLLDHSKHIQVSSLDLKSTRGDREFGYYQSETHIYLNPIMRFFVLQQSDMKTDDRRANDVVVCVVSGPIDPHMFSVTLKQHDRKFKLSTYRTLIQIPLD